MSGLLIGAIRRIATHAARAPVMAPQAVAPVRNFSTYNRVMQIKDKKALVFGGTSGIGLATARQLRDLGAKVLAISRDPNKVDTSSDDAKGLELVACDVRDREALAKVFAEQAPFDILICAAPGGSRALGPFLEMDMDAYQASFDKLWGYANVVRFGASHLTDHGCIVLVSGAPARRPKQGQVALASVGGAVEQFARAIAPEIAPRRINVVCPGIIDTPMFGPESEARRHKLVNGTAKHLIPRAGTPDEVAQAFIFLVQNEFVTGTVVDVDGGCLAQL